MAKRGRPKKIVKRDQPKEGRNVEEVEQIEEPIEIETGGSIDCSLIQIREQLPYFDSVGTPIEGNRYGKYLGSCLHSIKEYGTKKFAFGCYLDIFDKELFEEIIKNKKEKQTAAICLNSLNKIRVGKKRFGEIEIYSASLKEFSNQRKYLSVVVITNMRKNKYLYGEGYKKQRIG